LISRSDGRSIPLRRYAAFTADDLRRLRGYALSTLMRGRRKIPELSGVYVWRYWPTLTSLDKESFLCLLERWTATQPQFYETLSNRRVSVSITRTPFGFASDDALLGLASSSGKMSALLSALDGSAEVRQALAYTLESLFSAAPPLYIGKANNLQSRLSDHFDERSSTVLGSIRSAGIGFDDIYISFVEDSVSTSLPEQITTTLEELMQRVSNPPFTKRFG
jgi:hypothetical protein